MSWIYRIDRASGPRWRVTWRTPGGKQPSQTFKSARAARAFKAELDHSQSLGGYTDPSRGRIRLAEFVNHYLRTSTDLMPSTRATYRHMLSRYIVPALGQARLNALRMSDIKVFLSDLADHVGAPTVESVRKVLHRVMEVAVVEDLIAKNPVKGVPSPSVVRREPRTLSPQEVYALAAEVPDRYRALVLTLAYCGLRIGEASALRVRDLDLVRGRIEVVQAATLVSGRRVVGRTKTKKSRSVLLPEFLREGVAEHLSRFGKPEEPDSLVFTAEKGGPINQDNFRKRYFNAACKRIGIDPPPHVHDLRHTLSRLLSAEGDLNMKALQEALGHSSIRTTIDIYGHLDPTVQGQMAKRLDSLYRSTEATGEQVVRLTHRPPQPEVAEGG